MSLSLSVVADLNLFFQICVHKVIVDFQSNHKPENVYIHFALINTYFLGIYSYFL